MAKAKNKGGKKVKTLGLPTTGPEMVEAVVARILTTIDHCNCQPAADLAKTMSDRYQDGFAAAYGMNPNFWANCGDKVTRMAGYAASIACFIAERESGTSCGQPGPTVTVDRWLMAMAIIRNACLVSAPPGLKHAVPGLPCNVKYLPIEQPLKDATVATLAAIIMHVIEYS